MILPLLTSAAPVQAEDSSAGFKDITGSYAEDAINRLANLGIVTGTSANSFSPDRSVTRAELVTLFSRTLNLEPVPSAIPAFRDVAKTSFYYPWIQAAVSLGWVNGRSPDRFAPTASVTREEAAVMAYQALKQQASAGPSTQYEDQAQVSSWAVNAVQEMNRLSLMTGDQGKFNPKAPITRAEAAVLLDRIRNRTGWTAQLTAAPKSVIQLGWQYDSTTEQFKQQALSSGINTLSPRWLFVGPEGVTTDTSDPKLVEWAHANGKKVWIMTGNRSNQEDTHTMLSQSGNRSAAVNQLAASVRGSGADGINLDFENVAPGDRQSMTLFVSELANSLHSFGAVLSVNVSPDTGSDWTAAYDYAALGASADYIVMMGYDEHWAGDQTAGSVDSLPWIAAGLQKLQAEVPASKTILAMPFYTRDWSISSSGTVSTADWTLVQQNSAVSSLGLIRTWNDTLSQYTSSYSKGGIKHQLWLEDSRSLSSKMQLALNSGAAGFAYWYMGGESPDVWAAQRNAIRFSDYLFN